MPHTAVILIALGGPRNLDEVGPFMEAFMGRPAPPPVVAAITERYKLIGGASPLPGIVKEQAYALKRELGSGFRVYEGFQYSHPTIEESFAQAVANGADRVIGLSLSPFETEVTTGLYRRSFEQLGDGTVRKIFIPSWHVNPHFIDAWEEQVFHGLKRFRETQRRYTVVIFTSHSVPMRYIDAGDLYKKQIEETVAQVVDRLKLTLWRVAWQSKAARATEPWIEPDVESTMDAVSRDGMKSVLEVPIGFICDNMETLYDIDIVHRTHAKKQGIEFERAESLNTAPLLIKALADVVRKQK